HAAVRDQVSDISWTLGLMNQEAVAQRNLYLPKRIMRVARFQVLAWTDAPHMLDPDSIGRHPFRIPDDLPRFTAADDDWVLLPANADLISLHLAPVLPQNQFELRYAHRYSNISLCRLPGAAGFSPGLSGPIRISRASRRRRRRRRGRRRGLYALCRSR